MTQAVGVVDVGAPQPVGRHSEILHDVVHGIAHGDGGQAVELGHHVDHVLGALKEAEAQPPRRPHVEVHHCRPPWQEQHLADQPLEAPPATVSAYQFDSSMYNSSFATKRLGRRSHATVCQMFLMISDGSW